jgi:hypothetical protein
VAQQDKKTWWNRIADILQQAHDGGAEGRRRSKEEGSLENPQGGRSQENVAPRKCR